MKNRKKLKGKKLYVNEDVTKWNQNLHMLVHNECCDVGLVYTRDGVIFIKRRVAGRIFRIQRREDLEQL